MGEREAYNIFFEMFLIYLNEVVSDPDDWISHASAVIVLETFHQDDSANKVLWSAVGSPLKLQELKFRDNCKTVV